MRRRGAICVLAVVLAACAQAGIDSTLPRQPTTTAAPTTAASTTTAPGSGSTTAAPSGDGSLVLDGYTYTLESEDACFRLEVQGEDMEPVVEERCPPSGYWYSTFSHCADPPTDTRPGDGEASETTAPCLRRLPTVLYGYVPEDIGYLCLPSTGDQPGEFGPVTFVERSASGLLLEALPTGYTTPFPYTAAGTHWGEPPLDAPAWVIYAQCDAAGPWAATPAEISLEVLVQVDAEMAREGQVVSVDPGNGGIAFDLSAFAPGNEGFLSLRVSVGTTEVRLGWSAEGSSAIDLGTVSLPPAIAAEAASGWACRDAPVLFLTVAPGRPVALSLDWLTSVAAYARLGMEGVPTERVPGDPCPDIGEIASSSASALFTSAYDGYYRFEIAPEVLTLGAEWMLLVRSLHAGWALDLGHLASSPGERYWGYLFPGTIVQVGIEPVEAADPGIGSVATLIPGIPPGLDGPYLLVVTVSGYSTEEGRPVLLPEDVTLHWEHDEY
jgi:hypothetical protein